MLNLNTKTKPKTKPTLIFIRTVRMYCICVSLSTTVVHNTAQNSSDSLASYPPARHMLSTGGQRQHILYRLNYYGLHKLLLLHKPSYNYFIYSFLTVCLLMAALRSRCGHCIFSRWFLLSFFFFSPLISAVADWMSAILAHMVWP